MDTAVNRIPPGSYRVGLRVLLRGEAQYAEASTGFELDKTPGGMTVRRPLVVGVSSRAGRDEPAHVLEVLGHG